MARNKHPIPVVYKGHRIGEVRMVLVVWPIPYFRWMKLGPLGTITQPLRAGTVRYHEAPVTRWAGGDYPHDGYAIEVAEPDALTQFDSYRDLYEIEDERRNA